MTGLCRPSRWEEVAQLKTLWKDCFGDDDAYIDHYFNTYYRPERALVLESGGRVASMLLTFPNLLRMKDGTHCPACYIYAFCTRPEEQGRGYGRKLLVYAEEQAACQGCKAAVMVPGEGSLYDFYAQLGYETAFFYREVTFFRSGEGSGAPRPCTLERYTALRESWLSQRCHVAYPLPVLDYQRSLCQNAGGNLYELGDGVAAVEADEETLFVKELLSSEPEQAVSALLTFFGKERAEAHLPARSGEESCRFGVVKWLSPGLGDNWDRNSGYLAFGFD